MVDSTRDAFAVIGMACRFPGARDVDEFWKNLTGGVASISTLSDDRLRAAGVPDEYIRDPDYVKAASVLDDMELFDADFFGVGPRDAEMLDPQHRVFLEICHTALQHAGYDPGAFGGRVGLYAGARHNEYLTQNVLANRAFMEAVGEARVLFANHLDYLATGVAYRLDLRGPALNVVTACSTSLVAVHMACEALRSGQCEIALAGGVEIRLPVGGYFYTAGAGFFSPDGTVRPFDANANGTVFGSGAGAVAIRRLSDALADRDTIHAVIAGSAVNNDGSGKTALMAPAVDGQAAVIDAALAASGIEPAGVGFVEAHGTGSMVSDPIEVAALDRAYRRDGARGAPRGLASVKGNVGHLGAAAGVCGLIKTVKCVGEGLLPASLNFTEPNPQIDFESSAFYVVDTLTKWRGDGDRRRAGVSAFGVGGTNAHVILEEPPGARPRARRPRPYRLLTLSAHTASALEASERELAGHLAGASGDLADIAYTLNVGRADRAARRVLIARDTAEAVARLRDGSPGRTATTVARAGGHEVVFLFPGQGTQYPGMARGLYEDEPDFAAHIDRFSALLAESHGLDLAGLLFPEADDEQAAARLARASAAQPALFAVEYALARLLESRGIEASAMAGHGVGEYVAACLAGVMDADDAIRLVADQGSLVPSLPGGSMLTVLASEEALRPLLPANVAIAAVNAPEVCVASGPHDDVRRLREALTRRGIASHSLPTSHALHSPLPHPVLEAFRERVRAVRLRPPHKPFQSNVTGTWITAEEATDPEYWVRQLRGRVRFTQMLRLLVDKGTYVFTEVGPGRALGDLVRAHAVPEAGPEPTVVSAMRRASDDRDDPAVFLEAIGRLWEARASVDWERFWSDDRPGRVPLPTYPYERRRFWVEADEDDSQATDGGGPIHVPTWRETPPPEPAPLPAADRHKAWVVFRLRAEPVAGELIRRLRDTGQNVIVVEPGTEFTAETDGRYTIRVDQRSDHARIITDLVDAGYTRVRAVHAWGLGNRPKDVSEQAYARRLLDEGLFSALHVMREAALSSTTLTARVSVITSAAQDVAGDGRVEPAKSSVLGLVTAGSPELASAACQSLDVGSGHPEILGARLFEELTAPTFERQVAFRGRKRWVPAHSALRLSPTGNGVLRERGVYVITGGLGELGLELARQLAHAVRARLVLLDRTSLPNRSEWPRLLASGDDESTVRRIRGVHAVEEAGGAVLVCSGDVTDEARMHEVRGAAMREHGPVDGVFHLAGIARGGRPEARTREAAERVFATRVTGMYVADEVFHPKLLVLHSSRAEIADDYVQTAHAGANSVMDAYAQAQWASGRHVVSINWPDRTAYTTPPGSVPSRGPLSGDAGALRIILGSGVGPQVVVSPGDPAERERRAHQPTSAVMAREPKPESAAVDRRHLSTPHQAPESAAERALARLWQEALGVAAVGLDDSFLDLGGNSVIAVRLVHRMSEYFQTPLSVKRVFAAPTIRQLAAELEGHRKPENG
ncbi:type I polyketide synthase [Actinomadura madurae]|uniref:type I polyketide synthase n=1 Tax=Actinomadura madurae TaxID=1993 RepID=UPI000D8D6DA4|nr:type I polyketide synthase [Actinomadura madurae]SPT57315.1 Beta-ketoacyl-acyl-carrier-protein synthase I [Actinomadura madurae]